MSKTILCKEGYLIPKIDKYKDTIELVKKELTVEPFKLASFVTKEKSEQFTVYQENDEYLCIPKHYGLKKFGKPDQNKEIKGEKIKAKFNGELRPKQKEIVEKIVPHLKSNDGGVLCLPCAAGKTVLSQLLKKNMTMKYLEMLVWLFLMKLIMHHQNIFLEHYL